MIPGGQHAGDNARGTHLSPPAAFSAGFVQSAVAEESAVPSCAPSVHVTALQAGGHCPLSGMRKQSAGWGNEHRVDTAGQWVSGRALDFRGLEPPTQQDLAFFLQGLMGNMGEPGLKGDKVI